MRWAGEPRSLHPCRIPAPTAWKAAAPRGAGRPAALTRLTPASYSAPCHRRNQEGGMYNDYKVIDADAHIAEPYDLWTDFMEPEYYDRRPLAGPRTSGGGTPARASGSSPASSSPRAPAPRAPSRAEAPTAPPCAGRTTSCRPSSARPIRSASPPRAASRTWTATAGQAGPHRQLPPPHAHHHRGADQGLIWACTRAYNNWARAFADTAPSRLKNVGVMPDQHDIEGLVTEARRVVEKLGAVTVVVPRPPRARPGTTPSTTPSGRWPRSWTSPCPSTASAAASPTSAPATSPATWSPGRRLPWSTPWASPSRTCSPWAT